MRAIRAPGYSCNCTKELTFGFFGEFFEANIDTSVKLGPRSGKGLRFFFILHEMHYNCTKCDFVKLGLTKKSFRQTRFDDSSNWVSSNWAVIVVAGPYIGYVRKYGLRT